MTYSQEHGWTSLSPEASFGSGDRPLPKEIPVEPVTKSPIDKPAPPPKPSGPRPR